MLKTKKDFSDETESETWKREEGGHSTFDIIATFWSPSPGKKWLQKVVKKLADLKELKPQNVFLVTSSSMQR